MDSLPREIIESIVYLLDNDSLDSVISVYPSFSNKLNWSIMYLYRFNNYQNTDFIGYSNNILLNKLKHITNLDISFEEMMKIQKLNLVGKNLLTIYELNNNYQFKMFKIIPKEIFKLINLEELSSYSNQIQEIPKEINKLINLKRLIFSNNQITEIPETIGSLINLEILNLNNNQIKVIPKEIGQLKNLKYLYFNNNYIKEIPDEIWLLQNLIDLYLINNPISDLFNMMTWFPESHPKLRINFFLNDLYLINNPIYIQYNDMISKISSKAKD